METAGTAPKDLDFAVGDTVMTITVTIVADKVVEDIETFELELTLRTDTLAADSVLLLPDRDTSTVYIFDRTGN